MHTRHQEELESTVPVSERQKIVQVPEPPIGGN